MDYLVVAEIEIDGSKMLEYTNITLRQKFNAHHEFTIRINHDQLESSGSFTLDNAKKKIGKSVIIRLQQKTTELEVAYEFRGIICEIRVEQSGNSDPDLVLVGYSPTILIENGQNLASFHKKGLTDIVGQVTKPLDQVNCTVNIKPQHSKKLTYICQYKESGFQFINRLSSEFSEFFFYDGKELFFGKPSSSKEIEVIYGEDVSSMQLRLQAQPMNFTSYSYISKDDKVESYDAPSNVDGLSQYASFMLKESDKLFSEKVNFPVKQRVEKRDDLENFVKKQKASIAAGLEVLTGMSYNPNICIGGIINVKISRWKNNSFVKEDYGKFRVTNIEHDISEQARYFNRFEAVPAGVEVIPVSNVITPIAEPQVATVKDNKDPDGAGRVRVQMLWQQKENQLTDWVRVMTPDAGTSGEFSKNRGMVFIPEVGDQVLVCFRYNDADRPFVLGSMFHGKSGGGGGDTNKTKSLATRSGHLIELNDQDGAEKITIKDKNNNIITIDTPAGCILIKDKAGNYFTIDATNNNITAKDKNGNFFTMESVNNSITLQDKNGNNVSIEAGGNSIGITAKGSITLAAASINLVAAGAVNIGAGAAFTLNAMSSLSNIAATTMLRTKSLTHMVTNVFSSSATTINQTAKKDINHKAKGKMIISAEDKLDQHAGEMDVSTKKGKLRLNSNGDAEIKGTQVKIN